MSAALDFDAVAGMVAACRDDWRLREFERAEQGTDFVAFVTCDTPTGEREAVLKATVAEWMDAEIARSEPRLFALVGRETDIPVPDVYGYVDRHEEYPAPFYLVERCPGENFEGRADSLTPTARERVVREAGVNLAALHALGEQPRGRVGVTDGDLTVFESEYADPRAQLHADIDETCDALADGTYFPEYAAEPRRFSDLAEPLRETLHARTDALSDPAPPRYCHWDYRYGNLLVNPETGRTEAVLDWANLSTREPAYNLANVESQLFDPYGSDSSERVAQLRTLFRESYAAEREGWTFTDAIESRIETYLLKCRADAMACLPLWLEDATPREKANREREHRAFIEQFL